MANQLIIPFVNPIRFVPVGTPQYKQFDNDWYKNLVRSFEQPDNYAQKWIEGTPINLQFTSNFGPLQIDVIRCDRSLIASVVPVAVPTTLIPSGFTVWEATINPPAPEEGTWYLLFKCGVAETLEQHISEPQQTVLASEPNIMTVQYRNSFNDQDVIFDTGIEFIFCVEAIIGHLQPKSKRTLWEDQPLNLKSIESIPFRQFPFILGGAPGVPDWVADKMNRVFCCDYVLLDGEQFTQAEDAEWVPNNTQFYPRQGMQTEIRPTQNRAALISENNNSPAESFAIVYNINTRAYGTITGTPSNDNLQITKVQ